MPRQVFIDEAAEVVVTLPFSPEAIAAAQAELGRGIGWRTCAIIVCTMIGAATVFKEGSREPTNAVVVVIDCLFLLAAALLFLRRPHRGPPIR